MAMLAFWRRAMFLLNGRYARGAAAALAAVGLAAAAGAQAKRPLAVGDLITAVRVADPQLSPDGRTVVFVRTTTDTNAERRNADIWTVPADGSGEPREIIAGEKTENSPRYSPDGSRLAFISTRGGAAQVYVGDAGGGNVTQVTRISGGVQPPLVFSPDGTKIAFVSDVYPECRDEECNRRTRESVEKDPVKVRRLTRLMFRHWDEWRENVRHHIFVADVHGGDVRDVTPGDFDSPPHFYEDNAVTFSPDGREVVFVSKGDIKDEEAWSTNHEVWSVPVAGGAPRKVTRNPAADMQPAFSPDGKLLAVRAQRRAGFEADRWYLDLYDRATGTKRTLFETPDLSVADFRFAPDGSSIWFTAEDRGVTNLYVVPVAGGPPKPIAKGGVIGSFQPSARVVIFSKSALTAPSEIYRVATTGGAVTALTRENRKWLDEVALSAPESLTATGAGGVPVQYWLLKPPNFTASRKYPVVFIIHGGPQGASEDAWSYRWNPALWAAQGWVVAAPNPRGSTGFGQKFVDEISQDWCGKVMSDLNGVFDTVAKLPYVDTARMGIAGASYGGYAVNWIVGQTGRFKAAVSHDGVFNLESMALATEELWFVEWEMGGAPWSAKARQNYARCSPHLHADKIRTPTLIITNELDFRVPLDQGLQLFTALRRNGVPAQALVFPDEGHWINKPLNSQRWHEAVFGWMRKYLDSDSVHPR
jgi:dipeptidyl aminopeptidase/acylaminoacyl peptidase